MQRETTHCFHRPFEVLFQSSPSMQRETVCPVLSRSRGIISILSLYAEGDARSSQSQIRSRGFQSSPSMQRETELNRIAVTDDLISILSLYAEGDGGTAKSLSGGVEISILSLYAEGDILDYGVELCV